jgi:hypothetical protein
MKLKIHSAGYIKTEVYVFNTTFSWGNTTKIKKHSHPLHEKYMQKINSFLSYNLTNLLKEL